MRTPFTVAEETLAASSAQRGLGGMERTAAPKGPNMFDSGAASKVGVNTQPYNNQVFEQQSVQQNVTSAIPQASSNAVQKTRKEQLVGANAEYKAEQFKQEHVQTMMSVMNTPATLALGNMNPPEAAKFRNDIATSKAMAMGINPDIVQSQVQGNAYN